MAEFISLNIMCITRLFTPEIFIPLNVEAQDHHKNQDNSTYHLMKKRFKCVPSLCNSYYASCPDFTHKEGREWKISKI